MHNLRNQHCSDDQDRVYALYGLKRFFYDLLAQNRPNDNARRFEVEYTKSGLSSSTVSGLSKWCKIGTLTLYSMPVYGNETSP